LWRACTHAIDSVRDSNKDRSLVLVHWVPKASIDSFFHGLHGPRRMRLWVCPLSCRCQCTGKTVNISFRKQMGLYVNGLAYPEWYLVNCYRLPLHYFGFPLLIHVPQAELYVVLLKFLSKFCEGKLWIQLFSFFQKKRYCQPNYISSSWRP
jgi:hypothetical protein